MIVQGIHPECSGISSLASPRRTYVGNAPQNSYDLINELVTAMLLYHQTHIVFQEAHVSHNPHPRLPDTRVLWRCA